MSLARNSNASFLIDPSEEGSDPSKGLGRSSCAFDGAERHNSDLLPNSTDDSRQWTAAVALKVFYI
jgi:hypothetical protein